MFSKCTNIEELKRDYHRLARQYHPDNGGSKEKMQQLNAAYDNAFDRLKNIHVSASGDTYTTDETTETPEMFREIIEHIVNLPFDIEIIGRWIWVSGNTYTYKNHLKQIGFRWAKNKCAWYWHTPEDSTNNKKKMTLDEIRSLHGTTKIKTTANLIMS